MMLVLETGTSSNTCVDIRTWLERRLCSSFKSTKHEASVEQNGTQGTCNTTAKRINFEPLERIEYFTFSYKSASASRINSAKIIKRWRYSEDIERNVLWKFWFPLLHFLHTNHKIIEKVHFENNVRLRSVMCVFPIK